MVKKKYTTEFKRIVVAEAFAENTSVAKVAIKYKVTPAMVYKWKYAFDAENMTLGNKGSQEHNFQITIDSNAEAIPIQFLKREDAYSKENISHGAAESLNFQEIKHLCRLLQIDIDYLRKQLHYLLILVFALHLPFLVLILQDIYHFIIQFFK